MHGHVSDIITRQQWQDWPSARQLSALLPGDACSGTGAPLHFATKTDAGFDGAAAYERHIHDTGEIPLRPAFWHDLFNALMWIQFPAIKTALNEAHCQELDNPTQQRSARRDALTLLDECGVLIGVTDMQPRARHAEHRWHDLFVTGRAAWHRDIVPMMIGHGLCEQGLHAYIGLTGKALYVTMETHWLRVPHDERRRLIDTQLAGQIRHGNAVMTTKELLPLPLLGVPGWWPDNENDTFYSDADYFRPKRQGRL
ncbi:MAG: DUF3025 domain-containing protein [Gammaproteobacteria bacterium]